MLIPKVEARIKQYLQYLEQHAYRQVAGLEFELYATTEPFRSPPVNVNWTKITTPAPWGAEWTCYWFRTRYHVPADGGPYFLSVTPNADSLAFIDGVPAGAFNIYHTKLRVAGDGEDHTLHVEAYAGHYYGGCGPFEGTSVVVNIGKTLPSFPNTFDHGYLLERREAVHTLFYDVRALYETAAIAEANSLRKAKLLHGLSAALAPISFRAAGAELEEQAARAAERLAPLLALRNGPTTPTVYLAGHAHIDHAWLWPIAETKRKVARTFANMTRFAREYPEFIFLQSQPCQLEIVRQEYPAVFAAVRAAYERGNWEPNGGMWIEADCNIPSGESLIRQFLVGKQSTRALLGYEADTLWLPDVFGYAAALPQIMAGCRIKYFVTSKINWNDTTRFPYETFIWRGIDGTGIKTHFLSTLGPGAGYNGRVVPEELAAVWNAVQHKEVQSGCVKSIGEGDGGGGTLRADLEMARRLGDLEGAPRTQWTTVSAALDAIFAAGEFPEWRGELYLELHRGTYTTQSRTKRNNRMLEYRLRHTEWVCALAALTIGEAYPYEELLEWWKGTLTNQFHDIIPGSSIRRVYEEAEADSARMLTRLAQMSDTAHRALAGSAAAAESAAAGAAPSAVVLFNDLSWERGGVVPLPATLAGQVSALSAPDGEVYPVQVYTGLDGATRAVCAAPLPSLGWARYTPYSGESPAQSPFSWRDHVLTTPLYRITLDQAGRITSLVDRRRDRELVAPGGWYNALLSAEDVPVFWDAWDIDADWVQHSKQETRLVSLEVAADGPVCFRLRLRYEIGMASRLVQDMVCYADDPRIDFETAVSWHEQWRLLKVEFATVIDSERVRCEVQYGHLWRNTHRNLLQDRAKFEICAHKWIALEEAGYGIALLNDCKYGHDVNGGTMRLSLLRSPIAPDPQADQGEHRFTYALLPFAGHFDDSGVIRSAYELNAPAVAVSAAADSDRPASYSFCSVDGNAVIIESVKAPEDHTAGELVLRLYESLGGAARTVLRFPRELAAASQTDMLEDNPLALQVRGTLLSLDFRPFEIKTLRIKFR